MATRTVVSVLAESSNCCSRHDLDGKGKADSFWLPPPFCYDKIIYPRFRYFKVVSDAVRIETPDTNLEPIKHAFT
ncbi:hypothetical protein LshimejAT787_1900620 [Lyophyllum shimeji]|uniref:Uncharacterized protein n=1 Tax=Lyophyllum shimeji TaxID=47721 RepID=A0A9P3Q0S4_LYOSH|nr:hypothetical protein LshimejAT787_1900620 [Lyophyllum shimeji]